MLLITAIIQSHLFNSGDSNIEDCILAAGSLPACIPDGGYWWCYPANRLRIVDGGLATSHGFHSPIY